MKKKQLRERITKEIEAEAAALEQIVAEDERLSSLTMPEDSYKKLMEQAAEQQAEEPAAPKKHVRIRRRTLLAVALIAILGVAAGVGVSGAKLFVPRVENRENNAGMESFIDNDEYFGADVTEEEAYEAIEEKLGILALRLQYKPPGMELETVYISENMGEALLEFYYGDHILTVYENKRNDSSSTQVQSDGTVVNKIEQFYLGKELEIVEIDKNTEGLFYQTQLEYGNAYYWLASDMDLEDFEDVLQGLILKSL